MICEDWYEEYGGDYILKKAGMPDDTQTIENKEVLVTDAYTYTHRKQTTKSIL